MFPLKIRDFEWFFFFSGTPLKEFLNNYDRLYAYEITSISTFTLTLYILQTKPSSSNLEGRNYVCLWVIEIYLLLFEI